jgi:hypothetical protein
LIRRYLGIPDVAVAGLTRDDAEQAERSPPDHDGGEPEATGREVAVEVLKNLLRPHSVSI